VDIDNAAWSSSAVESQIAVHLPTACLSRLSLTASFGSLSRPIVENHLEMPSMLEGEGSEPGRSNHTVLNFLSLLDSAFSSLLVQSLAPTAPCIFSPGYLKVRQSVEFQVLGHIAGCPSLTTLNQSYFGILGSKYHLSLKALTTSTRLPRAWI